VHQKIAVKYAFYCLKKKEDFIEILLVKIEGNNSWRICFLGKGRFFRNSYGGVYESAPYPFIKEGYSCPLTLHRKNDSDFVTENEMKRLGKNHNDRYW